MPTMTEPGEMLTVHGIDVEIHRRGRVHPVLLLHGFQPIDPTARFIELLAPVHSRGAAASPRDRPLSRSDDNRRPTAQSRTVNIDMIETPVLIVGAGPVGLTASILLSQHGIRSLLVERHPGTAIVPKARGINARTMEMYRQCGVEQAIRDAGLAAEATGLTVWTESLAGVEIERRVPGRATPKSLAVTPVLNCLCAQDDLEPVLRRFAGSPAAGRVAIQCTEVTAVSQNADSVDAQIVEAGYPAIRRRVRAAYLIAADGAEEHDPPHVECAHDPEARERVYDSVNILFQRRSAPLDGTSSGRAVFRGASRSPRHLPDHQRQGPMEFPNPFGETVWLWATGFYAGALHCTDPPRGRRARPAGRNPWRGLLGSLGARCRHLLPRTGLPGR